MAPRPWDDWENWHAAGSHGLLPSGRLSEGSSWASLALAGYETFRRGPRGAAAAQRWTLSHGVPLCSHAACRLARSSVSSCRTGDTGS